MSPPDSLEDLKLTANMFPTKAGRLIGEYAQISIPKQLVIATYQCFRVFLEPIVGHRNKIRREINTNYSCIWKTLTQKTNQVR